MTDLYYALGYVESCGCTSTLSFVGFKDEVEDYLMEEYVRSTDSYKAIEVGSLAAISQQEAFTLDEGVLLDDNEYAFWGENSAFELLVDILNPDEIHADCVFYRKSELKFTVSIAEPT